ncbi:MAG: thioredoxin family protein [Bacteroidota bacterium]
MKNSIILSFILIGMVMFANAQEWQTDFDQAKEKATLENKDIILVFQGSDWCAPCMKLETEIWSTEEFKIYAADNYVMLLADFPKKKKNALSSEQQEMNNKLAETYNKNGFFPLVVLMDNNGKVLGNTGYKKMTPQEYIAHLTSLKH